MASATQALEVVPVKKQVQTPAVRDDVIDLCRSGVNAVFQAFLAPWLSHKLRRANIPAPDWQIVEPVPALRVRTSDIRPSGLMSVAVAVAHELAAPWMSARPERLVAHGLSPPGKTERAIAKALAISRCVMGYGA